MMEAAGWRRTIKHGLWIALVLGVFLTACSVEQSEEGEVLEVDVEEEIALPEYDVDAADVEIDTEIREIEVPYTEYTPAAPSPSSAAPADPGPGFDEGGYGGGSDEGGEG